MILDTLEVADNRAEGELFLNPELWIFECHYPESPMLPMSLLIESMTQVFIATFLQKVENKDEIPVISSIGGGNKISMKEVVRPSDKLKLIANLKSFRRGIAQGNCLAYKNDGDEPIMEFEIVEVLPSQMIRIR